MTQRLIIIDDSLEDRKWLADLAEQAGWDEVASFDRAIAAYGALEAGGVITVLLDYKLQVRLGIVHLGAIWARAPEARVVLVTGHATDTTESLAASLGLAFMSKDTIGVDDLKVILARSLDKSATRRGLGPGG